MYPLTDLSSLPDPFSSLPFVTDSGTSMTATNANRFGVRQAQSGVHYFRIGDVQGGGPNTGTVDFGGDKTNVKTCFYCLENQEAIHFRVYDSAGSLITFDPSWIVFPAGSMLTPNGINGVNGNSFTSTIDDDIDRKFCLEIPTASKIEFDFQTPVSSGRNTIFEEFTHDIVGDLSCDNCEWA